MAGLASTLKVPSEEVPARVANLVERLRAAEKELDKMRLANARAAAANAAAGAEQIGKVHVVAQRMAGEHVHSIVVLGDGDRRPWGVVTDRDVLRAASRIEELTAADALGGELLAVHPDERLADVAPRMAARGTSRVLVVDDRHGRPVGVLSTLDIAGILAWGRA